MVKNHCSLEGLSSPPAPRSTITLGDLNQVYHLSVARIIYLTTDKLLNFLGLRAIEMLTAVDGKEGAWSEPLLCFVRTNFQLFLGPLLYPIRGHQQPITIRVIQMLFEEKAANLTAALEPVLLPFGSEGRT